jgi:RHS repeat-associated protein
MPQHRRFARRAFDVIFWRPGTPSQARFVARHHVSRNHALQYKRARHYDPTPGRWLSEDPVGFDASDEHFYRYPGT